MKTRILLTTESKESQKARSILITAGVPFDELPAHPFWNEIGWPIPSFFTNEKIYKGLEEIEKVPGDLHYGEPN